MVTATRRAPNAPPSSSKFQKNQTAAFLNTTPIHCVSNSQVKDPGSYGHLSGKFAGSVAGSVLHLKQTVEKTIGYKL